jgi:ATP-dependent Clp protease adaptor protein ClpS
MTTEIDIQIDEKINIANLEPKKYNIIFINDNKTPMDWVVETLMSTYRHSQETAEKITIKIHTEGSACVGTYVYEIAEQKSIETINSSRSKGFPLQVKLEQEA